MSKYKLAIWALVGAAFLNALMGVWSRLLTPNFELFQQVGLRALTGGCLGAVLYFSRQGIKPIFKIGKRDFVLVYARSILMLIGILLFTYSINNGNFSNVNMIYALPTTALFGFIFLKERVTLTKIMLIVVSFIGALLVSTKSLGSFGNFSLAEFAAIISTFFYSLGYISRKWISKSVSSKQIATLGSALTGITALVLSFLVGNDSSNFASVFTSASIIILFAGFTYVFINYFTNYGFEHLDAVTANNLLSLNFIFGIFIGIIAYNEIPTLLGLFGGLLIVISAIIINYLPVDQDSNPQNTK
jgi:drug/metabolite transporter (DMT)-like permease